MAKFYSRLFFGSGCEFFPFPRFVLGRFFTPFFFAFACVRISCQIRCVLFILLFFFSVYSLRLFFSNKTNCFDKFSTIDHDDVRKYQCVLASEPFRSGKSLTNLFEFSHRSMLQTRRHFHGKIFQTNSFLGRF